MAITSEQKTLLLSLIAQGNHEAAINQCVQMCEDNLAAQLLERGGYGTLQLNPDPTAAPRIRFIRNGEGLPASAAKIGGALVHKHMA